MSLLNLVDIGKIYASENNLSIGIRHVNLSFEKGEFVAITGKSGSGKSTLLNIIGGMDSYEEGELYIQGKPTSHFIKEEWEEYSSEYISFIFQNYNILESFTVYENVFFALTSIENIVERKTRAMEIIKQVGLEDKKDIKGSVLSGGEKQRTVIARAIAKNSPIILADEPTGNLDSNNAKDILRLLHEISKDKLVLVVTHSYDDVKEYATRHIRLFDGKVDIDESFENHKTSTPSPINEDNFEKERAYIFKEKFKSKATQKAVLKDALLLGAKRYSSKPKQAVLITSLLTISLIALFLVFSLLAINSTRNSSFINKIDGRVLVGKNDTPYTQADAEALAQKYGATSYLINDKYLDEYVNLVFKDEHYMYLFDSHESKINIVDDGSIGMGEVKLKIPYAYKNSLKINDMVNIGVQDLLLNSGIPLKVIDIDYFVDNRKLCEFSITKEQYLEYANYMRLLEQDMSMRVYNFATHQYDTTTRYAVAINDDLQGNEIIFSYAEEGYGEYSLREIILGGKKINYTQKGAIAKEPKMVVSSYLGIEISKDLLNQFATTESPQISLFFENDKVAKTAMQQMQKDGYDVLLSTNLKNKSGIFEDQSVILVILGKSALGCLIGIILALIIILILSRIILSSKQDVAIFRTMGIKIKVVKLSTYVQLAIPLIPAISIMVIFALICYLTPLGQTFNFVGLGEGLFIVLAITILILILAKRFNIVMFKQKIKKGLRRVNK